MSQASVTDTTEYLSVNAKALPFRELFILLLIVGLSFFAIYRLNPPAAVSSQATASLFSSERAMKHLKVISNKQHPVGSYEHQQVRAYLMNQLVALGMKPEIQETTIIESPISNLVRGGEVHNILARMNFSEEDSSKAILLVAHYDSRANSFGASDDGAGVSAILETLRALKFGERLKNDVIALFTDAEEIGLFGAKAFVNEHAWAKDVGLVLNFEARGTSGSTVMFETSKDNRWMIEEFAKAATYPSTNSLLYELYRIMPNDTDMTVFKRAGMSGLNFAYINDSAKYHTSLDNYFNIDERSLQHHGSYALSLTRHFGNLNLSLQSNSNAIYFDILRLSIVHYPATWAIPLTILVMLLFVVVVINGLKKKVLTIRGMAISFIMFLLSMIIIPGIVYGVWWVIRLLNRNYQIMPPGNIYRSEYLYLGFVALSVAIFSAFYSIFRRKIKAENLTAGAALVWLILLLATSIFLPGGSYLFTWPLISSLLVLGWRIVGTESLASLKNLCVSIFGMILPLILLVPIIYLVFVALTVQMAAAAVLLLVLLLGLLIPQLSFISKRKEWFLPYVLFSLSAIFFSIGISASGFNASQPRQNNVFYGLDADSGSAVWASTDSRPDGWTSQFLSSSPERGTLEPFFPGLNRMFLKKHAPLANNLEAPNVLVLQDDTKDNVRTLHLRILSRRLAPLMFLHIDDGSRIQNVTINGKQITTRDENHKRREESSKWGLQYFGMRAEGIELLFNVTSSAPLKLKVIDHSYGLPEIIPSAITPRPKEMMPSSSQFSDITMVSKSFTF